jgi:hypothetical protein
MYSPPWAIVGDVYYPAGCSFVGYLVRRFGAERLRAFLGAYDCDSQHDADKVASAFRQSFGVALDDADAAWRKSLAH